MSFERAYRFDEAEGGSTTRAIAACCPLVIRVVEDLTAAGLAASSSRLSSYTWPAATALAQWVFEQPSATWERTPVLELGCGTGLVGLTAARRGAHVTLTDRDPPALQCVAAGLLRNALLAPAAVVETFEWGACRVFCDAYAGGGSGVRVAPRIILGADVFYDSSLFFPLLQAVKALLELAVRAQETASPPPRFVTAYHVRSITRDISPLLSLLSLRARLLPMPVGSPLLLGSGEDDGGSGASGTSSVFSQRQQQLQQQQQQAHCQPDYGLEEDEAACGDVHYGDAVAATVLSPSLKRRRTRADGVYDCSDRVEAQSLIHAAPASPHGIEYGRGGGEQPAQPPLHRSRPHAWRDIALIEITLLRRDLL